MNDAKELSLVISSPEQGQFLKRIEWNYDEFKGLVQTAMERYEGVTFTEEQVKEAKEERARLNALKKAISDQRIRVKNEVMAPYTRFESEVNEITALIDKPIAEIDRQVKLFEDGRKADKKDALRAHFEKIVAEMEFKPTFEQFFDERYLNVSVSLAKAKKDLDEKAERFRFNLATIEGLEEEYRAIVRDKYLKTLDMALAMNERNLLVELKRQEEARKAELKRQEEERKAREAERKQQADARKAREVETREPVARGAVETPERVETAQTVRADAAQMTLDSVTRSAPGAENKAVSLPTRDASAKRYKASFTVVDTLEKILAVKKFMEENGIHFEKGVK